MKSWWSILVATNWCLWVIPECCPFW